MGEIASRLADMVIITDDNPRSENGDAIAAMVLAGCVPAAVASGNVRVCRDRRVAIESTLAQAVDGDLVLIAGKGHESTQTIGAEVYPFNDADVAAAAKKAA
jgi:UDP-N-acetylmuramoyl-L-alanyl-D-glutamate--2,6-diaminopimelate ligase